VTLAETAAELYGLPPEAFTGVRNARAKEVAAAGDRALAAQIRGLAKPTAAAWLANVLARVSPSIVDELIGLGPELQRVQRQGERDEMRRIVDRRRVLIGELVGTAAAVAGDAGTAFGSAVRRQLEETLEAAVADEGSGAALRRGHLSEPLRFVGFGPTSGATQKAGTREKNLRRREAEAEAEAARAAARREERALEASVGEAEERHRDAVDRYRRAVEELGAAEEEKTASRAALTERRRALARARRRSR